MKLLNFYTFTFRETDKIATFFDDFLVGNIQTLPNFTIPTWEDQFEHFWGLIAHNLAKKAKDSKHFR